MRFDCLPIATRALATEDHWTYFHLLYDVIMALPPVAFLNIIPSSSLPRADFETMMALLRIQYVMKELRDVPLFSKAKCKS